MRSGRRLLVLFLVLFSGLAAANQPQQQSVVRPGKVVNRRYNPALPALPTTAIATIGGKPHLTEQVYSQLKTASKQLLQKYPPDQHVYIGLGRDPAPFVAFLQAIGTEAMSFPSSGKGHTATAILDQHFDQLIPASVLNGTKTIVLLDQTSSGKTHVAIMPLLRSYLQRRGSGVQVKGVAFYPSAAVRLQSSAPGLETINTTGLTEVNKFMGDIYEGVIAPYERHTPSVTAVSQLKWRPQFLEFRDAVGKRIERDQELDTFLSQWDK